MPADTSANVSTFMPLFCRDFLASTIGWTAEEIGHYTKLLMLQWDRGDAGLPEDLPGLERLSPGVSACWGLIGPKFPVGADGQRRNRRLEEHRADAVERRRRKSEAGKMGNRARWGGGHSDDHAVAGGSQSDRGAIADGSPPSASASASALEEEKNASRSPPSRPKRPSSVASASAIEWSREQAWQGITDADREAWRVAYPAADLRVELAKAHEWLLGHPAKARRSNWRRFITGWLTRCQDRGGTHREAPGRAAAQIRTPRPDLGGQLLSDDEYARERRRIAQQAQFRREREQAQRERAEARRLEQSAAKPRSPPQPEPVGQFDHEAALAAATDALRGIER